MNKTTHSLLLSAALAASFAFSSTASSAEFSGNFGVASNYLWRGMTQTGDESAVSGGIDYAHKSGFYAGTWTSNVAGGYELDLYAGYGMKAGSVDLDMGLISYEYPVASANFREGYVNASLEMFNAGLAYTVSSDDDTTAEYSTGDIYISFGAALEVSKGLEAAVTLGSYNFDDSAGDDFSHLQISASKDDFTFAIDKNNRSGSDQDKARVSVSWSKGLDL